MSAWQKSRECKWSYDFLGLPFSDLRKRFEQEPINTVVEASETAQLQCLPPPGLPTPEVSWQLRHAITEVHLLSALRKDLHLNDRTISKFPTAPCSLRFENLSNSKPAQWRNEVDDYFRGDAATWVHVRRWPQRICADIWTL